MRQKLLIVLIILCTIASIDDTVRARSRAQQRIRITPRYLRKGEK